MTTVTGFFSRKSIYAPEVDLCAIFLVKSQSAVVDSVLCSGLALVAAAASSLATFAVAASNLLEAALSVPTLDLGTKVILSTGMSITIFWKNGP